VHKYNQLHLVNYISTELTVISLTAWHLGRPTP